MAWRMEIGGSNGHVCQCFPGPDHPGYDKDSKCVSCGKDEYC